MPRYTKTRRGYNPTARQFPETLRVRATSKGGTTTAAYIVAGGVATLMHRTEARGVLRARAFGFARGGAR
jgi:hypothetical protein